MLKQNTGHKARQTLNIKEVGTHKQYNADKINAIPVTGL
jgi:hypothetical protein